ncbi:MAG: outer membrane protein OmpA-like peptidoglycan-associated protein, partial [Verrucomicrobiales bacterium]
MVATAEPSREETAPTAEPEPDPEPSPDPEPEANQTAELERLIADTQIYFSSGSTRVRETEREKLTALTQQLSNTPEQNVDIRGLA